MTRHPVAQLHAQAHPELDALPWDEVARSWLVTTRDGVAVWVHPLMYTTAIIVGRLGAATYDDRWCYTDPLDALAAARAWGGPWAGGEPAGWHRHPATGRRRPGGDPATEIIEH